jgi:predicted Zn-dependent protease
MDNEAIARFEAKVAEKPENELFRFSLGKALLDAGRWEEAEAQLEQAINRRSDWMVVAMLLARCAEHRKDFIAARRRWEQALGLAVTQHHEDPEREIRTALQRLDTQQS